LRSLMRMSALRHARSRESSVMRVSCLAIGCAASVLSSSAFAADIGVAAPPPLVVAVPPAPYVLYYPPGARRDLYIVNQGPVYDGPNITWFVAPTYSESGYAIARPYPYIHSHYWSGYGSSRHYRRWYRPYAGSPVGGDRHIPAADAHVSDIRP
jgi:hypothetical protein